MLSLITLVQCCDNTSKTDITFKRIIQPCVKFVLARFAKKTIDVFIVCDVFQVDNGYYMGDCAKRDNSCCLSFAVYTRDECSFIRSFNWE